MRIVIVDFEFPEPDRNSGGHRLWWIVKLLVEAGHEVSFLSTDYFHKWEAQNPVYEESLKELGVRTAFERSGGLGTEALKFLAASRPDAAILCRHYIAKTYAQAIRTTAPDAKIILDLVDLHHARERLQQEVTGEETNWVETEGRELEALDMADRTWAITKADKDAVRSKMSGKDIKVVPNIHPIVGGGRPFSERSGIVFVGNYVHSPNRDAVASFVECVMPRLAEMGCGEPFRVVGPGSDCFGIYEGRCELVGWAYNLDMLLCGAKVGVAPLRYGSGMKGKIGSYMACGLPCVTTSVGAQGMRLIFPSAVVADRPGDIAMSVFKLCRSQAYWSKVSEGGLRKVEEWSPERVAPVVLEAVKFH